jgi:hypothetical protein
MATIPNSLCSIGHSNKDQRPKTKNKRRTGDLTPRSLMLGPFGSAQGRLWLSLAALAALALLFLSACGITPEQNEAPGAQAGGSFSPEAVAESFFEDLGKALKDPQLANDQQRGEWVERLAGYFAPAERDDQRIALRTSLDSFTNGLAQLEPNESLTLDLKIERLEQISQTADRALIRPVNGAIYVLITRTTSAGVQNLYEESVPLERIIGNNGAVPVLKIGRSWYLTEG